MQRFDTMPYWLFACGTSDQLDWRASNPRVPRDLVGYGPEDIRAGHELARAVPARRSRGGNHLGLTADELHDIYQRRFDAARGRASSCSSRKGYPRPPDPHHPQRSCAVPAGSMRHEDVTEATEKAVAGGPPREGAGRKQEFNASRRPSTTCPRASACSMAMSGLRGLQPALCRTLPSAAGADAARQPRLEKILEYRFAHGMVPRGGKDNYVNLAAT